MHKEPGLKHLAFVGILWSYLGSVAKLIIQVGIQVVLARLLGPHNYGVFAIGVLLVSFFLFFTDICSTALIPRESLSREDINFAFTWQISISILIATGLYSASDFLANIFKEQQLVDILKILSIVCVLNGFSGISLAMLRKRADFKSIQASQVIGYFIGYVIIGWVYAVYIQPNANALAWAWVVQMLTTTLLYNYYSKLELALSLNTTNKGEILRFGFHSLISNWATWGIYNVDKFFVSKFFNPTTLGFYNTSYNLLASPITQIFGTLQQLIFSLSPRLNSTNTSKSLNLLVAVTLYVLSPIFISIIINADLVIKVLYGEKWYGAGDYLAVFGLTTFLYALGSVLTPLIWTRGEIRHDAVIQVLMLALIVAGCVSLLDLGAIYLAYWVTFVYAVRAFLLLVYSIKKFGLGYQFYIKRVGSYLLMVIPFAFILLYLKSETQLFDIVQYASLVAIMNLTFYILFFVFRKKLSANFSVLIDYLLDMVKRKFHFN